MSILNVVELIRPCYDFAFFFLIGEHEHSFEAIPYCDATNDYSHDLVAQLSNNTHLSDSAIYTRLFFAHKMSLPSYRKIMAEIDERIRKYYQELKEERIRDKEAGVQRRGSTPKPIKSDLLISTVQAAFDEGVMDEYQVCKTLKISPEKMSNFLQ